MTGGGVVGWSKVGVCGRKEGACEVATTHPIFDQPLGGARKRFSSVLLARDAQIVADLSFFLRSVKPRSRQKGAAGEARAMPICTPAPAKSNASLRQLCSTS